MEKEKILLLYSEEVYTVIRPDNYPLTVNKVSRYPAIQQLKNIIILILFPFL